MRRKDREITNIDEIINIINHCDVCRIGMYDGEYPYIVPMNFGMEINDDMYLYFHCASEGKKLDILKQNPKVSFEMDCEHNIILYKERMSCTMGYASVMGKGIVEFIEDDKINALKIIMDHYHSKDFKFNTEMANITTVFRIKVIDIIGKRRNNIHPNEKTKIHIDLEARD